jgi:hypothetical protein
MAKLKKAFKWLGSNFGGTLMWFWYPIITLRDNSRMENLDEWDYFETIFICLFFAALFVYEIVEYRKKQKVRKMD